MRDDEPRRPIVAADAPSRIKDGERLLVSWYHPVIVHSFPVVSCLSGLKFVGFMYTTRQHKYDDRGTSGRAMRGKDGPALASSRKSLPADRPVSKRKRAFLRNRRTDRRQGAGEPRGCGVAQGKEIEELSEDMRKEIFLALVEAQDQGTGVAQSRKEIAERFGVSEAQVRQIESEGINGQWPPL